tara:strand:+ start:216 stop:710 length:495 start_codon:yes stop_codon:yes gene_type:complete
MYEVIDDFLDKEDFIFINNLILNEPFPWFYMESYKEKPDQDKTNNFSYYLNILYENTVPTSQYYETIMKFILKKIEIKSIIRVKLNSYIKGDKLVEHEMHRDYDYFNHGAVFSINTCDGYTKLEDGTKIDSVANRILVFDASKPHCSTNTTNQSRRVNINFNFF